MMEDRTPSHQRHVCTGSSSLAQHRTGTLVSGCSAYACAPVRRRSAVPVVSRSSTMRMSEDQLLRQIFPQGLEVRLPLLDEGLHAAVQIVQALAQLHHLGGHTDGAVSCF